MATEMKRVKLHELSLVKRGANPGARVVLVKHGDTEEDDVKKFDAIPAAINYLITKELDGEGEPMTELAETIDGQVAEVVSDLVRIMNKVGMDDKMSDEDKASEIGVGVGKFISTIREKFPDAEAGLKKLLTENSATAEFFTAGFSGPRSSEGDNMPLDPKVQKQIDDLTAATAELTKKLEAKDAEIEEVRKASMPPDHQAWAAKITDPKKKAAFLASSPADRAASMKKELEEIAKGDEEIKVGDKTIKKSVVGDDLFSVVKNMHGLVAGQAADIMKLTDAAAESTLVTKIKSEYPNVPGEALAKARLLREIEKISPESRKTFEDIMKAANQAIADRLKEVGGGNGGGLQEGSAEAELNSIAKKLAAENKVDFTKGYEMALDQNPALYARYEQERAQKVRAG